MWRHSAVERLLDSSLARNTLRVLAGRGLRMSLQAIYFVLIARALGPADFGAFVAVLALAQIASPFANWGMGNVLVRNVSRYPDSLAVYWGNSLLMNGVAGVLLVSFLVPFALWLLPADVSIPLVLLVGVAELIFAAAHTTTSQAFQALEQMKRLAQLEVAIAVARLVAAVLLLASSTPVSALVWAQYYLAATAAAALMGIALLALQSGRPRCDLRRARVDAAEGFYFAAGLSSTSIHNNLGKAMLPRLASLDAAGVYGAAHRIIDVAFQPVAALIYSSYPRFFREGVKGAPATVQLAVRLLPASSAYAALSAAVFFAAAPLVPALLGAQYEDSAAALRWLALLPLTKTFKYLAADALTGAGYQRLRMLFTGGSTIAHLLLALWLIPVHAWRGAAVAALLSETLLAMSLWLALAVLVRAARHEAARPSAEQVSAAPVPAASWQASGGMAARRPARTMCAQRVFDSGLGETKSGGLACATAAAAGPAARTGTE